MKAGLAFSAGIFDDARLAMDEARDLDPELPGLSEMQRRLAGALAGPEPELMLRTPEPELMLRSTPVEAFDGTHREEKGRRLYVPVIAALACACMALVAAASFGWRGVPHASPPASLEAALRGDVTLPADPVMDAQLGSVEPPRVGDHPPVGEPAAISTSGASPTGAGASLPDPDLGKATVPPGVTAPERTATETAAPRRDTPVAEPQAERRAEAARAESLRDTRESASNVAAPPPPSAPATRPQSQEPEVSLKPPVMEAVPLSAASLASPPSIAVSAPEPAPSPRTAAAAPAVDPQAGVRAALARYEAAYSGLNVSAARAVWPAVDERALARAFDGLAAQRVALDRCDVNVTGATAHAACSGVAEWTPKVGGGQRRQNRRWAFDLTNSGGTWQIVRAEAR